MSLHTALVWLPVPLVALVLVSDVLDLSSSGRDLGIRGRMLVATALATLLLAAFTGLGARRRLPASVPGGPIQPWDVHVNWAIVLLVPALALGIVRIRGTGAEWREAPFKLILVDLGLLALVSAILATGLRIP